MAKLMQPLGSVEARGKVGGIIYNTWRGINYAKAFTAPVQPGSARQLELRGLLTTYTRAWATSLSAAQRADWIDYADTHLEVDWTGEPLRLTGQNWFVRTNVRLADASLPTISDPPSAPGPGAILDATIAGTAGTFDIAWTTPSADLYEVECFAEGPISAGRQPSFPRAKFIARATDSDLLLVPAVAAGHYNVWLRLLTKATGLISPYMLGTAAVT